MKRVYLFLLVVILILTGGIALAESEHVPVLDESSPLYGKTPVTIEDDHYILLRPGEVAYFLCVVEPGSGDGWSVSSFGIEAGAVSCASAPDPQR